MSDPRRWPPRVGARVRAPSGEEYDVVACGEDPRLGEHVVLRGWQTFPVTRAAWDERRFEVVGAG